MDEQSNRITVVITGGSGVGYGVRLLEILVEKGMEIHLVVSKAAKTVIKLEGMEKRYKSALEQLPSENKYNEKDFTAKIASGSFQTRGMVICPCSVKTLGMVANGLDLNLIGRSATCHLKEGRKVVLVPREAPYNLQMVENMRKAILSGCTVLPASPGFYHQPTRIEDLYDFICGKILDILGIKNSLFNRWGE
ncbi:MAG: UbiX family flavin prenyltransferase [Candidatus Hodarchaeales archaeon]|jgi:4-hydroxy-3-polyprenylbenzoate decarboxylase